MYFKRIAPAQNLLVFVSWSSVAPQVLDPKISDDGATVAFVWDDEVCAVDASGGAPRRLTDGARGVAGVTNGAADLVAAEEMDRYDGFWLAPGGKTVAYARRRRNLHLGETKPVSTDSCGVGLRGSSALRNYER